ncbi:uncharacterized protein [Periplaneta americana]|uniref:uncharacterized protein n=1 Tax=Periplaneta americana TaxID=6978 RepID=UPI0037E79AD5
MAFEWGRDNILLLAELLKANKCLWDVTKREYKDRHMKKDAYRTISLQLGTSPEEVEKKVHIMKTQFIREWTKVKKSRVCGIRNDIYVPKWYAFQPLSFLKDVYTTKKNKTNDEVQKTETEELDVHKEVDDHVAIDSGESSQPSVTQRCNTIKRKTTSESHLDDVRTTVTSVGDNAVSKKHRDEFIIFADFVASELKKISHDQYMLAVTKSKISQEIFDAQLRVIERESSYNSLPLHSTIRSATSTQTHTPTPNTPLSECSNHSTNDP